MQVINEHGSLLINIGPNSHCNYQTYVESVCLAHLFCSINPLALNNNTQIQQQKRPTHTTMVHICPICGTVCNTFFGLGKHIRSRLRCVSALGLLPRRAPKWKAASARPRYLHVDTQQALKSSVAPLWDDEDDNDDDSISPNNDLDDHLLKSTTPPPHKEGCS
jgi:hypothetical protein